MDSSYMYEEETETKEDNEKMLMECNQKLSSPDFIMETDAYSIMQL